MGWFYILIAGMGEILFIIGLKHQNRTKSLMYIVGGSAIVGVFLNQALLLIDTSVVYPLWVSIGSFWSILMGAFIYGELLNPRQFKFIALLFAGCIGLFVSGV